MALLDGDEVVYVAQVPSRHSMRMFTEVGRRVLPHSTGVGKALLAAVAAGSGPGAADPHRQCRPRTDHTITDPDAFLAELERIRVRGYAVDDNEQEVGVRCLAVTVRTPPRPRPSPSPGPPDASPSP